MKAAKRAIKKHRLAMRKIKISQDLLPLNPWAADEMASSALKTPAMKIAVAYDLPL